MEENLELQPQLEQSQNPTPVFKKFPKYLILIIAGIVIASYFATAKTQNWWPFVSEDEKESEICIQVITPARNPKTGEIRDFPTPCDVPEGWEKIESEVMNDTTGWQTYRNEEFGFEVKYPNFYSIDEIEKGLIKFEYIQEPSKNYIYGGRNSITITVFENGQTYDWAIKGFQEPFLEARINKETLNINGNNFVKFLVASGMDNVYEYFILKNKKLFSIYTSVLVYDKEDINNKILSTFKFIESTSQIDTSNWKTYRNEEFGFEVKYPESLTLKTYPKNENVGEVIFSLCLQLNSEPGTTCIKPRIVISFYTTDPAGKYFTSFGKQISYGENVYSVKTPLEISGKQGFEFSSPMELAAEKFIVIDNDTSIITVENDSISNFQQILSTFKFTK